MYQKTYATIVAVSPAGKLTVRCDDGKLVETHYGRRNGGRTPMAMLQPGLRIKLYRRPGNPEPYFRRVGR
jgi:hypothetical protein